MVGLDVSKVIHREGHVLANTRPNLCRSQLRSHQFAHLACVDRNPYKIQSQSLDKSTSLGVHTSTHLFADCRTGHSCYVHATTQYKKKL